MSRVPLTLRHVYDFGEGGATIGDDLLDPAAWDAARDVPGPFALPSDRTAWEQAAEDPERTARAKAVIDIAQLVGGRRIVSYGVGTGMLELMIAKQAPELELVCTEYAPRTRAKLAAMFSEAEVVEHDLRRDPPLAADLHLLHRIDSELNDDELRRLLHRFAAPVLFVPTELLSLRTVIRELKVRLTGGATRAGWVRTRARFERLWRERHDSEPVDVAGAIAFLLRPRD